MIYLFIMFQVTPHTVSPQPVIVIEETFLFLSPKDSPSEIIRTWLANHLSCMFRVHGKEVSAPLIMVRNKCRPGILEKCGFNE